MSKLLFVDHAFHLSTASSKFFVDLLETGFDVTRVYIDPNADADLAVFDAAADADYVVVWQMDYLAPLFVALGKRTIVIPMYDGSANFEKVHWQIASGARYINFSLVLHWKLRDAGCDSLHVRYFVPPVERPAHRFDKLNAFFWRRRPDFGIDVPLVDRLIGPELASLHVHNAPDIPGFKDIFTPLNATYRTTYSDWFENKSDYYEALDSCNVFVCPRPAEGIGMAMLEAMARGMVVLANDQPTHVEYISNWVNGILFNSQSVPSSISIREFAPTLSRNARLTVEAGHEAWEAGKSEILSWIETCPEPAAGRIFDPAIARGLIATYRAGRDFSQYYTFIARHLTHFSRVATVPLAALFETSAAAADQPVHETPAVAVEGGVLDFTRHEYAGSMSGWSVVEPGFRWIDGPLGTIRFSIEEGETFGTMTFRARTHEGIGKLNFLVSVNGLGNVVLEALPHWQDFTIAVPDLREVNTLEFRAAFSAKPPGDSRSLSLAVQPVRLSRAGSPASA